jgi:murein L,D-transpeptidase YcbB/YkuD
MERLRWQIANPKGANYISVNFADFNLKTILDDTCAISMKICCGKSRKSAKATKVEIAGIIKGYKTESPMLYGSINQIILYPEWNVPSSIMEGEYYVKLKNNSQRVLEREKMYLVRTADRQVVDATTIDWTKIKRKQIPYQLVQTSGYHNALGIIKFNFPNVESVYLHDTPVKRAFNYRYRDISHGCIRVEKPLELAQMIFRYNGYTDEQLECIMIDLGKAPTTKAGKLYQEKQQEKEEEFKINFPADKIYRPLRPNPVNLKKKLPIYLEYYTCFVDDNGVIQYRDDVYEKEENILKRLKFEN